MTHSMKTIITLAILLAVLICSGVYTVRMLHKDAGIIESQINRIEELVKKQDWAQVKEILSQVEEKWSGTEKTWTMLIDHTEIDYIDISLTKLKSYVEAEDTTLALGEIGVLRQYIRHIPEKESFRLKNLF